MKLDQFYARGTEESGSQHFGGLLQNTVVSLLASGILKLGEKSVHINEKAYADGSILNS